ncbi:MAG TPA: hypothetical protein VNF04_13040 [Stellaceae bacterium]|nr:hypothetical protein [Stellaceae bacterium]
MPVFPDVASFAGVAPSGDLTALDAVQANEAAGRAAAIQDFNRPAMPQGSAFPAGAAANPSWYAAPANGRNAVDVLGPIPPRDLILGRPLGELPPEFLAATQETQDEALATSPTAQRRAAVRRVLLASASKG